MKDTPKDHIPEEVVTCVAVLCNKLNKKVRTTGFCLTVHEVEEARQIFLIRCYTLSVQFKPDKGLSLATYLHGHTIHAVEEYLRNRNRKKQAIIREAQSLDFDDGGERFADSRHDLDDYMQQDEQAYFISGLEPTEQRLLQALLDCGGNLLKAATSLGMTESRARYLRKAIQEKFIFFKESSGF